jgi:hypothetical protein
MVDMMFRTGQIDKQVDTSLVLLAPRKGVSRQPRR